MRIESLHVIDKMADIDDEEETINNQANEPKATNFHNKEEKVIIKNLSEGALLCKLKYAVTFQTDIKWKNVFTILTLHAAAVIFVFTAFPYIQWKTFIYFLFVGGIGGFGVTAGVHRYWTHRSYKAKLPLKIILAICYSVAGQNTIYDWVRDHRVHHKFSETDADPHNSNRGFFFAHVGWLLTKKRPEVISKGNQIDMSDILEDPIVKFDEKYHTLMTLLFCFILPSIIPVIFWGEYWHFAIQMQIVRFILNLNFTWCVNSAAHMWGQKPYDRKIQPAQNPIVSFLAMGEGWHNYHHVFPWDYKAAELGNYGLNITTFWIDLFAKIGWAYDLKHPSSQLVMKTIQANGDGSHNKWGKRLDEVPIEAYEKYKSS